MKKIGLILCLTVFLAGVADYQAYSQGILKKIKDKVEDKVVDKVVPTDNSTQPQPGTTGRPSNSRVSNTRGEGLTKTPPDVIANLKDAGTFFADKKYKDSRFAARQAILGVELEIGKNILEGLPESINGLPKVPEEDFVASSGIGFVGLIIERYYRKDDQELKITIGNDAALLAGVNMYLASGNYATTTDQNHKLVKYKDYRAVLEYDESSGYKLSVPFGQTSVLIVDGVNFANEQEIMGAADKIDIEKIKKELGEQ